jgi:DNA-binding transcriptional LysR family regulator
VPLALVAPKEHPVTSAEKLWKQDRITDPLISGRTDGAIHRLFQSELQKRKVEWFPSMELTSQELIARYVAEGFGIGLMLVEPGAVSPPGTKLLPLSGFPTIPYGLLWTGTLSPLQRAFCEEAHALAAAVAPK